MNVRKLLEHLTGLLAATALFAIMTLTFFDVLGRKFLDNSIPGSLELTELLMVVVIFAALPLVSERGEHVLFDSLDAYLSPAIVRVQEAVVNVICGAVLLLLAWLMWKTGGEFAQSGEVTAQIRIPKAPFIYGMAVLCAVTGIVHLLLIAKPPAELAEGEGAAL